MRQGGDRSRLDRLFHVIRWRWLTIVLLALPVAVGTTLVAQTLPPYYDASALVSVEPEPDATAAVDADSVRAGALTFVAYATAPATLREVAQEVGRDADDLADGVRVELEADASAIRVVSRHASPSVAAETANAVAARLLDFRADDEGVLGLMAAPVAEAVTPTEPAGPPRELLALLGGALGLALGLLAGSVQERWESRVRSVSDLEAMTGRPVVGALPRVGRLAGHPAAAFQNPAVGTAIRSARIALEGLLSRHAVLTVTSPLPKDGKSTVASLLATSLARLGFEVLLIDGDVRQAGLTRSQFGVVEHGLLGVLGDEAEVADELRDGWVDGLSILPTSTREEAGDLLERRFPQVARELSRRYDVTIVDAPPLLGSDEARVLAGASSATLLVVAARRRGRRVAEAMAALDATRARTLGVLANRLAAGQVADPYALVRSGAPAGSLRASGSRRDVRSEAGQGAGDDGGAARSGPERRSSSHPPGDRSDAGARAATSGAQERTDH